MYTLFKNSKTNILIEKKMHLQAEHLFVKYLIKKVSMMMKFVSKCLKY